MYACGAPCATSSWSSDFVGHTVFLRQVEANISLFMSICAQAFHGARLHALFMFSIGHQILLDTLYVNTALHRCERGPSSRFSSQYAHKHLTPTEKRSGRLLILATL